MVLARYARNERLGDAVQQWALGSLKGSPGARACYDALRARNIGHQAALRQLANRLVGILHGCLKTGALYDETTAWAHHHSAIFHVGLVDEPPDPAACRHGRAAGGLHQRTAA